MNDWAEEVVCKSDPEALICICDPPCGATCAFPDCENHALIMVPGELVFGFQDGAILDPVWGNALDPLLSAGGWDTWVCEHHGF